MAFRKQQNSKNQYKLKAYTQTSASFFKYIRKLQSKKSLSPQDISDLARLIEQQHVSILEHLSPLFIRLRNELILSEFYHQKKVKNSPHFKSSDINITEINFSKYFKNGQSFNKKVFFNLYQALAKKLAFYQYYNLTQYYSTDLDTYQQLQTIKNQNNITRLDETVFEYAFPSAYHLYQTLKNQLSFMPSDHLPQIELNQYYLKTQTKDKLIQQIIKQQFIAKTTPNATFEKPLNSINSSLKLQSHEFYDVKSFLQKIKNQVSLSEKDGPFANPTTQQFKSIPINCIGCASYIYQGKSIPRDRSSMINFQVIRSVNDSKNHHVKQLIEGFINSPNGGVILFDCDDFLFQVYPRGRQTNLKKLEFKKQSIIDICKNNFKDFHIDKDYTIDFILLHDQNDYPIIKFTQSGSETQNSTGYFITRMKIFSKPPTSNLKANQQLNQRIIRNNRDKNIIAHQVINNSLGIIDYDEMKMRFYRNQNIMKNLDKEQIQKKVQDAFYHDDEKFTQLIRGRLSPLLLHQNYGCKSSQMIAFNPVITSNAYRKQTSQKQGPSTGSALQKSRVNPGSAKYKNWILLIVNIDEVETVKKHLKILCGHENFEVEAPFQQIFHYSGQTLLIKSNFKQDEFATILKSQEAQKMGYLRCQTRDKKRIPLKYIKVYPFIRVEYKYNKKQQELKLIKKHVEEKLKKYFTQSKQKLNQKFKINMLYVPNKQTVYFTTVNDDTNYVICFLYMLFKQEAIYNIDTTIMKAEFKQSTLEQLLKVVQ